MSKLQEVARILEAGQAKLIEGAVQSALDDGIKPQEILDTMIATMGIVGDKFQRNEIFVPEMLVAAMAMKKGVAILQPSLADTGGAASLGTCVIGTVIGDLHDVGKNLVALMIESAGFKVVDLGVDVPPEKFVEAVKAHPDCNVVAISALLTTTMEAMKITVEALIAAGVQPKTKILVGGAPITQDFCDLIKADGYAPDAGSAGAKAKELVA